MFICCIMEIIIKEKIFLFKTIKFCGVTLVIGSTKMHGKVGCSECFFSVITLCFFVLYYISMDNFFQSYRPFSYTNNRVRFQFLSKVIQQYCPSDT